MQASHVFGQFSDTYGLWYVFPPHVLKTHVPDCFWLFLFCDLTAFYYDYDFYFCIWAGAVR